MALRSDELGAVLESLGPSLDARARLEAVVALFAGGGSALARAQKGAFAATAPMMTAPFTSGLHNCLRGPAVNDCQQPTNTIGA